MTQLRDYQSAAITAVYDWFLAGKGNPLVVAPTGAGKSVILSEFIRKSVQDWPGTRVMMLTHVKELIAQNYQATLRLWPNCPAGIYSAGLGKKQLRQVTFAGIQSVAKKAHEFGKIDILIVDECHLIPRKGATQYQRFIRSLLDENPHMKVIGLTATPFRLDSGRLDSGPEAIFDGIAYDIPIAMLVKRGYLSPLVSKAPHIKFDTRGLHTQGGEWIESEMAARFNTAEITRQAVVEIVAFGAERRSWLIFCINVEHALAVRDEIRGHGFSCETITGDTPAHERAAILQAFKDGRIRALTNVNVLTTGFDAPATDLLGFLRPTQSLGLYMQMAGRAMRIADGKTDGLVLDFAGNVERHGPVDGVNAATAGAKRAKVSDEKGDAPTKTCPKCDSILWIAARECPDCGHIFPEPEPKIEATASTEAIMNLTAKDDWKPVRDFQMMRHVKDGVSSLRVEYLIGAKVIKEFVCLEHKGFARQKAVQWWHHAAGTTPPNTVQEALDRAAEVRVPEEAVIRKEGEFWRVARVRGERQQSTMGV